jgi:4-hydroxy-4-methyl-2-oxoglutarate aldolase
VGVAVDVSTLDALKQFDTGTLANAIDRLELRPKTVGYSSTEIRCLFPQLEPVVGFAVTCREDTTSPRIGERVAFASIYRLCEASSDPTIVVCQDMSGSRSRSCHLGDIMSTVMQRLGVAAFVTDGGVRDLEGIRANAPGFQVFASGLVPGAGECHVLDVGSPVYLGGMEVHQGDLVFGDVNGLLNIPVAHLEAVLDEAHRVRERETERVDFIRGDGFTLDGYLQL